METPTDKAGTKKVVNLCKSCKENPVQVRRGRKFTECLVCRTDRVKEALRGRAARRGLVAFVGKLVSYYECGSRFGYLAELTHHCAIIQPIGPAPLARRIRVPLSDVRGSNQQSTRWPTLADYVASMPKPVEAPAPAPKPRPQPAGGDSTPAPVVQSSNFDTAKAVELYRAGQKIVDIAVALGYPRGQGQNRTRKALRDAGVLQ